MTTTNPRSSARPICQACNRPFDPRSAGATLLMGPTCAKRAGADAVAAPDWQLSLDLPPAAPVIPVRATVNAIPRPTARRQLPIRFRTDYDHAKMAFDELFREFCLTGVLLTGDRAGVAEAELLERVVEVYSLDDPALTWLRPEHDLCLLVDADQKTVYHRRVINDVVTLLEITPARSATAAAHVATITGYVTAWREFAREQDAVQLSLF